MFLERILTLSRTSLCPVVGLTCLHTLFFPGLVAIKFLGLGSLGVPGLKDLGVPKLGDLGVLGLVSLGLPRLAAPTISGNLR